MVLRRLSGSRPALVAVIIGALALVALWALPSAFGQGDDRPGEDALPMADEPVGLIVDTTILDEEWVDPIELFELEDLPLASEPTFDFSTLHETAIFEGGVENLSVSTTFDFSTQTEQHLRALQAVATVEDELARVEGAIAEAESDISEAAQNIVASRSEIATLDSEVAKAQGEIDHIVEADDDEIAEQERLWTEINRLNGAVAEIAIRAFIGEDNPLETFLDDPQSSDQSELRVVTDEIRDFQRDDIQALHDLIGESDERREEIAEELEPFTNLRTELQGDIANLNERIEELRSDQRTYRNDISELEDRRVGLEEQLAEVVEFSELTASQYQAAYHQRLEAFVVGTDLPLVALNAYVRAQRTLAMESPSCGIHWSQLAGIGRTESAHGNFGDSTLDLNGETTVDIRGVALDGKGPVMLIRDTDGGALDGDRVYDRAVGPMQFIPTTWDLYGADGNEDGIADPQNIYDAALSAARYLCAAPGSMITTDGEQAGYWAYNHDLVYSDNVTRSGRRYHDLLDVYPESSAFAAFAELPTPEEQRAIDEAAAEAEAACLALLESQELSDIAVEEQVSDAQVEADLETLVDCAPEALAMAEPSN